VSWHTQNHDGKGCSKIAPIPIGLDFHTPRDGLNPEKLPELIATIRAERRSINELPQRIFCDLGLSLASEERAHAVAALKDCTHVDCLTSRVSQTEIWHRYTQYPFVVSTEGNGLDCHRTWELLYLGCIVITRSSSLDPLYKELPVMIVQHWEEVCDPANFATWFRDYAHLTDTDYVWHKLQPRNYLTPIRARLAITQHV
jgi:hypothetical protein